MIEFARNVAGQDGAHSTEFNQDTPHPVIALITEWQESDGRVEQRSESSDKGGTMRLGAQECRLKPDSLAREIYGDDVVRERHRHRYEFNNRYREKLEASGLVFSGWSANGLVEMIELPAHPWYLACQFHPEFTANPRDGHPLFTSFVTAARNHRQGQMPEAVEA
mgnify:FL=1